VRYYVGVDWADQTHAVWVVDESRTKITGRTVPHTAAGFGRVRRHKRSGRAPGVLNQLPAISGRLESSCPVPAGNFLWVVQVPK
jgi:hypothetical protein